MWLDKRFHIAHIPSSMIIGDISDILVPVVTGLDILIMLVLILVVLMQRPKQEGLGAAFGSAMTDQMFGARTTDVLEKATRNLAIAFIVVTLILGIVVSRSQKTTSLVKEPVAEKVEETAPEVAPAKVVAPAVEVESVKQSQEPVAEEKAVPASTEVEAGADSDKKDAN